MLANAKELSSFKNHILNNEIDEANSIFARKQAAIRDATRAARKTLENLPRDVLGTALIPTDVTAKQGENIFALRGLFTNLGFSRTAAELDISISYLSIC